MSQVRQKLRAEFAADTLARGWATMTDQQRYDSLHLADIPDVQIVRAQDQRMWLAQEGRHEKLHQGQQVGATDTVKGLCRSALLMATNDDEYKRSDHKALLDALVAATVLSQADADALDGQCDKLITPAESLDIPGARLSDVVAART